MSEAGFVDDPEPRLCDLLARTAAGDAAGLLALFDLTGGKVFGMVLAVVRCRERSADVVHDVFAEVWQTAAMFDRDTGSAATWIRAIARRRAIEHARRQRAAVPEGSEPPDRAAAPHPDLDGLPATQREMVELAYRDGRTQAEIAALTGTPVVAVKAAMRAALTRARELQLARSA